MQASAKRLVKGDILNGQRESLGVGAQHEEGLCEGHACRAWCVVGAGDRLGKAD